MRYANLAPDRRAPRAMSIHPRGDAISVVSCSSKPNLGFSPRSGRPRRLPRPFRQRPSGRASSECSLAAVAFRCRSASSACASSSSSRTRAELVDLLGRWLALRRTLLRGARASARAVRDRQRASAASRASKSSAAARLASAARKVSGSSGSLEVDHPRKSSRAVRGVPRDSWPSPLRQGRRGRRGRARPSG